MDKDEIKKDEVDRCLEGSDAAGFETTCIGCPDCYRCRAFAKDALSLITEQKKEIEQLRRELAKEQEACVECELEHRWKVFDRNIEIDRLRAEKKNVVKEFAEKVKQAIADNTYPYFDKNGKPVNIWNTDGFDKIDELLKEYEK